MIREIEYFVKILIVRADKKSVFLTQKEIMNGSEKYIFMGVASLKLSRRKTAQMKNSRGYEGFLSSCKILGTLAGTFRWDNRWFISLNSRQPSNKQVLKHNQFFLWEKVSFLLAIC